MTPTKLIFKKLESNQVVLFPSNLSDRIPSNRPVRIVNQVVDSIDISIIMEQYKGGGTSIFHPRMMLKVLFYGYFCNLYSCRKIEQALHENIYFMWLSGNSTPDYRTINYFRGRRLKGHIQNLFAEVVRLMSELGLVDLEIQYIDGTKIESASNRYTFVWKKSVEKNKAKLESKIASVLSDIDSTIKKDHVESRKADSQQQVDSTMLQEKIDELNKRVSEMTKQQKKELKKLQVEHIVRLERYEKQLKTLGDRNSYSKTDIDATFMRMKDDHMKNGQLKPAYNVQISTENQFITNMSIHQRPGDTATLESHLGQFEKLYKKQSKKVVADAGYGSEQNYHLMEESGIEAFVKYNYFHQEQKKKHKNNPFLVSNLYYNTKADYYVCPMGQHMNNVGSGTRTSDLGFISNVTYYQAQNCNGCPVRGLCHKGKEDRKIEINYQLNRYKNKARQLLLSEEGIRHRGKRAIEPEAVFGQLKSNNRFNRLKLRGLEKVEVEIGLASISHNLRKIAKIVSGNQKKNCFQQFYRLYQQIFLLINRNLIKSAAIKSNICLFLANTKIAA